mgnify:CR=1 FL=1
MRKTKTSPDEYYHIYNRGNNKQNIFLDERDWIRFLFLILNLQSPVVFYNLGRYVSNFVRHRVFNISKESLQKINNNRVVELINFAQMPNHFHLIVLEKNINGISQYMQRIQNAYTKYFNAKYKFHGHIFQGPFKIIRIEDNEQLLHLSAYIHRNPREIKKWFKKEDEYPWSSYQDYTAENRWENLLQPQIILDQFSNKNEYRKFLETSGTKLNLNEKQLLD